MKKAKFLLILSMIIWGTLGIFVKHIPLSSAELAFCRAFVAMLLLGSYLLFSKTELNLSCIRKELGLLLLSGTAMGVNWILLFESYKYTTVSNATLSYYFAPILVTIICPFFFHEKLNVRQMICFIMSTAGVVLIIGVSGLKGAGNDIIGILFGLSAAVFYASVMLLNKYIKNVSGLHRTFFQFVAAVLILLPYVAFSGGLQLKTLSSTSWIYLLIVCVIHTGLAYLLYFPSLKDLNGQEAAILSYIDPLVAVLSSVMILGEQMTGLQLLGGVCILGFALLNERQK